MRNLSSILALYTLAIMGIPALSMAQVGSITHPSRVMEPYRPKVDKPHQRSLPQTQQTDQILPQDHALQNKRMYVRALWIDGSTIFNREDFKDIVLPYVNTEMGDAELNDLVRAIGAKYREAGYIIARAVPKQIKEDVLHLDIIEGYVAQVRLEGSHIDQYPLIQDYAQKLSNRETLNVSTLERYLLLINDLPGVQARAKVSNIPGAQDGAVELVMHINQKPTEGAVNFNNRGSRFLGRQILTFGGTANSMLGMFERFELNLGISPIETEEVRFAQLGYQHPLGTEGATLEGHFAYSHTRPGSSLEELEVRGESYEFDLSVNHPFIRSRTSNWLGRAGFSFRDTSGDFLDNLTTGTPLYDDRIRSLYLGTTLDFTDSLNGVTLIDAQVRQGLDILDATTGSFTAPQITSNPLADTDFTYLRGEVTRIQSLSENISLYARAVGQYSFSNLYISEQIAFGGADIGRAFDSGELAGDHGVGGIVELRFGDRIGNLGAKAGYQLYSFYDIGTVWTKDYEQLGSSEDRSSLASAGIGARFLQEQFNADLQLSFPLVHEVASEGSKGDEARFFLNVGHNF